MTPTGKRRLMKKKKKKKKKGQVTVEATPQSTSYKVQSLLPPIAALNNALLQSVKKEASNWATVSIGFVGPPMAQTIEK